MANIPVTIGGVLYPSQEWYDTNIAGKQQQEPTEEPVQEPVAPDTDTGDLNIPDQEIETPTIDLAQGRMSYYENLIKSQQAEADRARKEIMVGQTIRKTICNRTKRI